LILSVPIFECTPDLYVTDHSLLECACDKELTFGRT